MLLYYPIILFINYLKDYKPKPSESNNIVVNEIEKILTLNETKRQEEIDNAVNDVGTDNILNQTTADLYKTTEEIKVYTTSGTEELIKDIPIYDIDKNNSYNITNNIMDNHESELQNKVEKSSDKKESEIPITVKEFVSKTTKTQKCDKCNAEIEISEEEIASNKFICPVCNQENNAKVSKVILEDNEPNGISGWLTIPALGIGFGFLRIIIGASQYFSKMNSSIPSDIITFGLIKSAILFIILVILAIQFFGKKKNAPVIFMGFIVLNLILLGVESAVIDSYIKSKSYYSYSDSSNGMPGMIVASIVWIIYFVSSKRVKNTFIN